MTIETAVLAMVIATGIWMVRHHHRTLRAAWHEARWYEKVALAACLLPIPGPFDDIAALLITRRLIRRARAKEATS